MFDCVGNELHVGDNVVCSDGYYSELLIGKVVKFTDKMIVCNVVRSSHQKGEYFETRKYPYQVHLITYNKVALKKTFTNESADHPYTDYYCSSCDNRDSVYEDDNFCSMCGAKFVDNNYFIEKVQQQLYDDTGCSKYLFDTIEHFVPGDKVSTTKGCGVVIQVDKVSNRNYNYIYTVELDNDRGIYDFISTHVWRPTFI